MVLRASLALTARERAEKQHWDVTPTTRDKQNPAGVVIANEIRKMNDEARRNRAGMRRLSEALRREDSPSPGRR